MPDTSPVPLPEMLPGDLVTRHFADWFGVCADDG